MPEVVPDMPDLLLELDCSIAFANVLATGRDLVVTLQT
jgi:hypothetical protein